MLRTLLGLTALAQAPDTAFRVPADSYADSATAHLVREVRAARDRNERLVTAYTAIAKQRMGVGIRALSRDRMLYRSEIAARISWKRDAPSSVEVIGAREGVPIALQGDQIPEDLDDGLRDLVMNPAQDYLRILGSDEDGFIYPLRARGEADYRFALGDTTTIRLPSGQEFRLVALKVIPRRAEWQLISGTFWYDIASYGLVQAVFRPARPFEFQRDVDPEDRDDVPAFVNPTGDIKFVTIEYGLYEARWWMPRYMAVDAVGNMGSWLGVPFKMERVYEDYEVEGGTPPDPNSSFRPAGTIRERERDPEITDSVERRRQADSLGVAIRECIEQVNARQDELDRREARRARARCWRGERDSNLVIVVPDDTLSLLTSPELGEPILAMGNLISEDEIRGLADAIGKLPVRQWARPSVQLPRGAGALLQHARYNRIEALSLGLSGGVDVGRLSLRGLGRIGLADRVPNGELTLIRPGIDGQVTLGAYRRLAAANPEVQPFGPINSFLGLVAQRDDGEYYRTLGVELKAQNTNSGWWSGRVWFQRERPAEVETNASLPRLFSDDNLFRPNIRADSADQVGVSVTFRGNRTFSRGVTIGGELTVEAATGDYDLRRGSATVRLVITPEGPLAGGVTASAGTSTGTLPVQGRFYLGGANSLRGYSGGVAAGSAYWLGRAEIGNSFPAARVTLFTDVGWAGPRADFGSGRALIGAGVGASFLDGLLRFDLARGLRTPTGWRLEFYVDGII